MQVKFSLFQLAIKKIAVMYQKKCIWIVYVEEKTLLYFVMTKILKYYEAEFKSVFGNNCRAMHLDTVIFSSCF